MKDRRSLLQRLERALRLARASLEEGSASLMASAKAEGERVLALLQAQQLGALPLQDAHALFTQVVELRQDVLLLERRLALAPAC